MMEEEREPKRHCQLAAGTELRQHDCLENRASQVFLPACKLLGAANPSITPKSTSFFEAPSRRLTVS